MEESDAIVNYYIKDTKCLLENISIKCLKMFINISSYMLLWTHCMFEICDFHSCEIVDCGLLCCVAV
jgi:hypothetical protein